MESAMKSLERLRTTFHLPKNAVHRFETKRCQIFPESDFGLHDFHPMINKTLVDGTSARHIESIRTNEYAAINRNHLRELYQR